MPTIQATGFKITASGELGPVGPTGPAGPTGVQGPPGAPGPVGDAAVLSVNGLTGEVVVVTSINGQTGDVQLDLGSSAVTSVNGQIGEVELNIPITHVGRYEPDALADTWLVTQSIGEGEIPSGTSFKVIYINVASTPTILLNQSFNISMPDDTPVSTNSMIQFVVIGDDDGGAITQIFANDINNVISGNALITEVSSVTFTLTPTIVNDTIISYQTTTFTNTGSVNINEFQALALEVVE